MAKLTPSKLRIIGGQWRSRKIHFTQAQGLRPTGDRVREILFNWLAPHLSGANCLDLFAGSGALCLEALSRHAKGATALENNKQVVNSLTQAKEALQANNLSIIHTDAVKWLQQDHADKQPAYDIVFIDPPFKDQLIQTTIAALEQSALLKPQSLIYIEQDKNEPAPILPKRWQLLKSKTTGNIAFYLCQLSD